MVRQILPAKKMSIFRKENMAKHPYKSWYVHKRVNLRVWAQSESWYINITSSCFLQHMKHSSFLMWTFIAVHRNGKPLTTLSFPSGYLGKPSSAIESLLSYYFRHFFFKYHYIFLIWQRMLHSFLKSNYIFDVFTASQFKLKADFPIVCGSLHLKDLHLKTI